MRRLVDDELWELVEPLLPPEPENLKGGRPRVPSRAALEGIVYVLRSGVLWRMLLQGGVRVQRLDLLAAVARLAGGRRVEAPAASAAG
jgi:transposase